MRFKWDLEKAATNVDKHGVTFEEAKSIFADPLATTVSDLAHSLFEQRWATMGLSSQQRLLVVWHTDRGETIRIIGARPAAPRERRTYESR